jgi:uncharacterized Zn finger protein (UPF0148 family)
MESNETEYQCSDCGTNVSADAKICPNCGSSLEETSEEEVSNNDLFVQIPVTSHPANLSSILSLLDENKIDYSINDDAMENIWGPNFIQVPKLLVRKEQVEEVKEIINSIQEEVEVLDSEVFKKENLDREDKKLQMKGVEGWLLVFCMTLMLGPLAYLFYDINSYFEIKDQVNWIPLKETILIIDLILTIIISCLSVYAGWSLWKISSNAISITRLYLNSVLAYSLFFLLLITIIFMVSKIPFNTISQNIYGVVVKETISSLAYVIIWKLYLKNSERVKNTYKF